MPLRSDRHGLKFEDKVMLSVKKLSLSVLMLTAVFASAADIKLPIKMADVAARLKRNCPGHVKISANQDVLTIALSESGRKGGFDGVYALNFKRFAGKKITIMIDVKLNNIEHGGKTPGSVGKISFGDYGQTLSTKNADWTTYTFKSAKIPGNGLFKMRISLKNVSGEVQLRNPHVKADLPKPTKKKNKKKN